MVAISWPDRSRVPSRMPAVKSGGRCRERYVPIDAQKEDVGRVALARNPNEGKTASALWPDGSSIAKCRDAVRANTPMARSKPRIAAKSFDQVPGWTVPMKRTTTTGKASKPKAATTPAPTRLGWIDVARTKRSGPYTKTRRLVTMIVHASCKAAHTTKRNDEKPRASNRPTKMLGRKRYASGRPSERIAPANI